MAISAPSLDADAVADKDYVSGLVHSDRSMSWSTRGGPGASPARSRSRGRASQPGHIPGAKNLPHSELFNADGTWKRGDAAPRRLRRGRRRSRQADRDDAAARASPRRSLLFGAHLLGKEDVKLYDGSWAEWGADPATPKATGRRQ